MTDITNRRTLPSTRAGGPRRWIGLSSPSARRRRGDGPKGRVPRLLRTAEDGGLLPGRFRRAFTLVEMLVVISIISILLGLMFGAYFGLVRSTAFNSETRAVMGIVQSARSKAAAGGETFIRVDAANRRLYVFESVRVGAWHFETLNAGGVSGAFGHTAVTVDGGPTLAEGKIGKALALDGSYRLKSKMKLGGQWANIPKYDTRTGVAIEAWVMPTDAGVGTMTVISRDGWFNLSLVYDAGTKQFALAASATTVTAAELLEDDDDVEYESLARTTEPVVRPNEWTHVSMSCHILSSVITVRVNGIVQPAVAGVVGDVSAPSSDAETVIGAQADGSDPFKGRLDELHMSVYAANDVHTVSGKLKLEAAGLAAGDTVRFDSTGKLHSVHNGTTPKLILKDDEGQGVKSSVVISIGPMGALDVEASHD